MDLSESTKRWNLAQIVGCAGLIEKFEKSRGIKSVLMCSFLCFFEKKAKKIDVFIDIFRKMLSRKHS